MESMGGAADSEDELKKQAVLLSNMFSQMLGIGGLTTEEYKKLLEAHKKSGETFKEEYERIKKDSAGKDALSVSEHGRAAEAIEDMQSFGRAMANTAVFFKDFVAAISSSTRTLEAENKYRKTLLREMSGPQAVRLSPPG